MDTFLMIIAFFMGLIIIFVIGGFIGHILKLDEYIQNEPHRQSKKNNQIKLKATGSDLRQ
jgi:uncharacterized membrane protein YqgA involved in biofilm formation